MSLRKYFVCIIVLIFSNCRTIKSNHPTGTFSGIKLLDTAIIPFNQQFNNTIIGGLSGIDFDREKNQYYLICDDRSAINPARFYTADIRLNQFQIDTILFKKVTFLRNQTNEYYPNSQTAPAKTPDPEAIRYNPSKKIFVWTDEGERIVTDKDTILADPSINWIDTTGKLVHQVRLPQNLIVHSSEMGPRKNGVLEGICLTPNNKHYFTSLEEPLYEDGPRAQLEKNKPFVRFYKFNSRNNKNIAQYAYELDPIAYPSLPQNAFKVNGIPEILYLCKNKLLIIERSFSTGRLPCTIKVFIADLRNASNIKNTASLKEDQLFIPAKKKLLLNMDQLNIYTDNIEGVTFGPKLPNGHASLLFVSDNNFAPFQQSQVFLFEIIP